MSDEDDAVRRSARKGLGGSAPELARLTDDVLFGLVWNRPQLSKDDRSHACPRDLWAATVRRWEAPW